MKPLARAGRQVERRFVPVRWAGSDRRIAGKSEAFPRNPPHRVQLAVAIFVVKRGQPVPAGWHLSERESSAIHRPNRARQGMRALALGEVRRFGRQAKADHAPVVTQPVDLDR